MIRHLIFITIPVLAWLASVRIARSWRHGTEMFLHGIAWIAITLAHATAIQSLAGEVVVWCLLPLYGAAGWFGKTPLGVLNFLWLQWLGVRLQETRQRVRLGDHPSCFHHVRWGVLRWVWPLTGWWGRYRWIARCGTVREKGGR